MKICILMGSPRPKGHTAQVLDPFMKQLTARGAELSFIPLYEKTIQPCLGCFQCQRTATDYGCVRQDDTQSIMAEIMESHCFVLATPIYAFFCTAPMKAFLDRHMGMNTFYGEEKACLWEGKKMALITTHTYERSYASAPFETGMEHFCQHSHLSYLGAYSVSDPFTKGHFHSEEVTAGAIAFANEVMDACSR